jgi:hypothetical protein
MKQSPYRQVGPCAVITSTPTLSGKLTQEQRSRFTWIFECLTQKFSDWNISSHVCIIGLRNSKQDSPHKNRKRLYRRYKARTRTRMPKVFKTDKTNPANIIIELPHSWKAYGHVAGLYPGVGHRIRRGPSKLYDGWLGYMGLTRQNSRSGIKHQVSFEAFMGQQRNKGEV